MGKKSKRRGVGGCKKSNGSGGDDQILVPHEALMQVTAPKSWKGIISTNIEPTRCLFCNESVLIQHTLVQCCGKVFCRSCPNSFADISGNFRCTFCNALLTKRIPILQTEAGLGKAWAQNILGIHLSREGKYAEARKSFIQSAMQGNYHSFLSLSELYRRGDGVPRDLKLSEAYARKARALNADCGLSSNRCLLSNALAYIGVKDFECANAILRGIAKETDESALDEDLIGRLAARLWNAREHQLSAEMYVRAFCYYGYIESAYSASYMFHRSGKQALSKLWLDVACKTKSLYKSVAIEVTGEIKTWPDYDKDRKRIRSNLRELRNSCGGCGTALAGDRRKYCRCCRTYCYCNENCQKKHWDGGHRDECREVEEHMRKILKAIHLGKFADRAVVKE